MAKVSTHISSSIQPEATRALALDPAIERLLLRIRLRARRRIAWLRRIWADVGVANGHSVDLEVEAYLRHADTPLAEVKWYQEEEEIQEYNFAIAELEAELDQDQQSRIATIQKLFKLNSVETDILHICLALTIDPHLSRVFAYLNDHNRLDYITEHLIARLFEHGYILSLSASSPLIKWKLVREQETGSVLPARWVCDPYLRHWLLGHNGLDPVLASISNQPEFQPPLAHWPVTETSARIATFLDQSQDTCLRLFVAGAVSSGRRTFATAVASQLGLPVLAINSDLIPNVNWELTFLHAQRFAHLHTCALIWHGQAVQERPWPQGLPCFPLQIVIGEVDEFLPAAGHLDWRVELPAMSLEQRRRTWLNLLPAAAKWPDLAFEALLRRRQTTIGQIAKAARYGLQTAHEVAEFRSSTYRDRLGGLAQHLESAFTWEDLILTDRIRQSLEDFTFEATERVALWEEAEARQLFPQGRGLLALFNGPPGTGKTMAAQVIANSLQLELYRVDLSSIVSKYVGETSKNIERILSRAQGMDAVLLFDEADALFGKRTDIKDAHDRFANTDTNYLLQAIEQYPGIAILASNRKANIDKGFTRRLRYVVEFSAPGALLREQLWHNFVKKLAGQHRAEVLKKDLFRLAELPDLTGAQIKYAVLSAIYKARSEKTDINLLHLMYGLERELQKEGRSLGRQAKELKKRRS